MSLKFVLTVGAALAVSPALAQSLSGSVTVSESAPITQPLSPTLGATESLAIVTPAQAAALTTSGGTATLGLLPAEEQAALDALPRITPAQAATLIGGDLSAAPNAESLNEDVEIFVVDDGMILPAANWTASQSAACKASGGVELPLPAGRIGCFKL